MEQPVVSGVIYEKDQSKVTVKGVPDQPGIAARVFGALADASIPVDMIIQNVSEEGHTDISFTLQTTYLNEAMPIMKQVAKEIQAVDVSSDSEIAKISVVGAGMRSHAGVAARIFKVFSKESINIVMISTSEIRVSCIIEQKYTEQAVRTLHDEFNLAEDQVSEVQNTAGSLKITSATK